MSNQSQTTSQNIANNLKDAYNIANSLVYKVPGIGPAAQAIGFSNALIVNTTVDVVVNNDPAVRSILSLSASTIAFTGCSLGTSGNVIIGFGCGFLASKAAEEIYDAYFGSDFGSDGGRLELENSLQIGQSGMYRDSNGNIKVCYYGDDEVFEERSLQEIVSNVTTDLQVKSVDVTDTDTGTNVQIDDDNNLKLQTTAPITEPEQQSILQNIAPLARPTTATSYSIESGDTLSNIASANGTTVEALMELNPNITDPNIINVGDSLVLTQNQDAQVKNININGDEYNAYQSDVSEVNDSGILGEGEQVNITKIENEDGSIISFVEEQEVILSDGTQISSRELIHTGEEAKGALQNFMDSHIMQSVKQSFTDPETLSGWALDSVRMLANGEEIDDIATYIFLKSAIEGTIEGLVFDQALQTLELNNSQIDLIKNSVVEGSTQNLPPELQDMLQGLLESAKFQFISGSIVTFVTSILMQADDGLNSEEYAESAFQAIGTEAVSLGLEKAFPGLGGSVGHGAAMAITYAITRSISDIFEDDHMNSHQWNSMVNTSSAMFVSGMAGHAAGTAIATALASSTASAATLGMLLGPLGSMVAVMVVMSLIGGKEYGEGEYPNPYSFLKFTDKDDGTGQTIYGLEADGVVARARDGFDDDIVGTDGADNLIGGSGTNRIYGQEGNDHIEGRDSDDVLVGGTGNDLVEAGAGDDYIFGDEGSDIIYGGSGADQIDSGDGNDIVYGDSGDDVIVAGIGDDIVYGGAGDDQISAGAGDDVAQGGAGIDTILGEAGDDVIYGGADNDQLYGGAGSDLIVAGSGADTVYGEEDDDTIIGGAGIDMLYGDSGADLIAGGDAADLIMGGLGNDTLGGGAGDDTILGEIGDDQIIGGDGDDNISAGAGYDVMAGGLGDDILDGGADSDFYVFNSGDGFDEITDSAGDNDVIRFVDLAVSAISFVKSGDDLVISFAGNSTDQITIKDSFSGDVLNSSIETLEFTSTGIEGGDSIDLTALSYDSGTGDFTHAVTSSVSEDTDLQHVLIQDSEGQLTALDNFYHDSEGYTLGATEDNYVNVDYESYNEVEWRSFKKARGSFGGHYTVWYKYYESNMAGTTGVDRLVGSWWDENITGSESADYLYGNNGADVIYGEAGDDFIEGGDGADYLYGGAGSDVIEGAGGSDIIDGGAGDDRISTGEGADQVIAGAGNNVIIAEFGNNIIAADDGDNQIQAGSGNDQVAVGAGDNVINLGNGDNLLTAGDGANKIVSGDGDDEITVGDGDNQIDSGSGADEIVAGDGSNFIYSGEGNDQITVGDGSNQIYAGSGDDIIEVGAGDNEIYLGTGNDQLTVGAGNNVIIAEAGDNVITVMATSGNIDPLPDQASLSPTSPEAGSKKIEVESSYDPLPDEIEVVDALSYSPLEGESESGVAEGEDGSGEGQVVFTSIKTSDGNDNITISDGNSFIDAGDGNDVVILSDGDHELIAGDGDKNIRISEGNSDITLGDGDNVIDLNGEVLEFNSDYYIEHYGEFIPGLDETNDKANLALEHFQTIGKFNNYNPNNYLNLTSYAAILITAGIELAEGQTPYDQLAAGGSIEIASLLDAHIEVEEQDLSGTTNTVIIGNGNNVIYGDNSVNDIIIGDGDNQITSGRSDDQIIIGDGDNQIDSQAGSDQITIGDGDNQIDSGDGADQIIIGNGNNIITAGRGDDQIIAGDGDNILIYNKGDGSDQFAIGSAVEVALNSNTNIGAEGQFASNNIIQFADLDIADIALSKVDDDLLITISTTGEIITLSNYVDGNYTLQFSDDFEVELSNITVGSEFGDSLIGTEARDQILAAAGMDSLLGFGGSDYLAGDKGDDVIFGGMDDDAILGGEGNDYLDGGIGNDVLISGTGSDKMFGGAGLDKFIITKSPGATDKITDFNLAEDTLDLTAFGREFIDIKSLEDRASFNEKGDLVLDLGSQQSLVLQSSFPAGGTDLSSFNILFDIEEIEGLTGSDSNDIIAGTDNGDVIIDGLGLDILTGGAGADKFVISKEAGAVDVITDFAIGEDKIHLDGFGEINIDQLTLAQSGDDAVIEFSQGQKLTLRNVDASMLSSLDFKFDVFDGIGEYERYQGEYDFIAPELKSNLIAYYDFDSIDKGYDSSGNNKHGSTTGNIVSVAGISGNAGFFNSNDKINVGAFSNFNWGSDFSVSVWFQRTGEFSNYQGIVNNGYYNNGSWEIRTGSELGGTTIGGGVNTSINPTAWDHVDITASVNQWHHVMMSYDGANLAYYLDGELIDISNQDSGDLLIKNTALTIGQAGFGKGGEYFYGAIDELSLYDTALTADDAALLYGNQITYGDISSESLNGTDSADIGKTYNVIGNIDSYDGLKDNLLAYYNFDSIDKGYDSSGNNRHGSTTGNIVSVAGISGNAGFFNGNDKIDVGAFSDFNWGSDFSVSVWFQRTGEFKNYQGIVNNGYYNNGSWEIRMGNEGSGTMLGGGVITQGNTQSWDHKNLTAATNTWHHVVMSYDGKNLAYYLDGALKDISGRDSGDMLIKNTVLTIGQAGTGKSNEYFYGAIDELSLYDKALSAADVALLFNNQVYGEALSDEDYIFAGAGNDHITTYSANDEVSAGSGEDNISAGMGDDLVNGGEGDDYLDGGYGADRLYGEEGNDFLITGADNSDNLLSGGEGHDNIVTFSGNNVIDGGTGSDKITAGFGNDIIYGNSGFDHITSGAGSDIVYGGTNDDVIDGGDGNDHLMGDSGDDQLLGSSGNDLLEGGSGDDILNGGLDADWLVGAAGDDILIGGAGNDTLSGGEGADAYIYNLGDGYDQVVLGGDLGMVSDSLDVIRFGEGIAKADLVFSQKGDDLTITFSDYEGGLLLKGQFVNSTIATLEFADGLAVSLIDFSIINEDQSLPGSDVVIPENFNGLLELDGQTIWVTPVNDAPITEDITSNLDEDSSILIDISEYISDVDASLTESETTYLQGGNITLGKPLHGTVTLTEANQILYAPDSDYYGGDEFTYSFTDNLGITSTSKVTLTVNNIADIPIIVDNIELETKEDKSITIDANDYGYDADGETLTVLEVGEVTNGAVSIIDGKIIYTPNQDYSGVESFSYVVTDGETELSKNISLTITAENDAPVVVNSASEVDEDGVAIIDILRDVLDSEGDNLTITSISKPFFGAAELVDNKIIYIPDSDYNGEDFLIYTISDQNGGILTERLDITVNEVNDKPILQTITAQIAEDKMLSVDVLKGSFDIDGDTLSVTSVSGAEHGVATIIDNQIIYMANDNYYGTDSLEYVVSDGNGAEVSNILTITIAPVNDTPIAYELSVSTLEESEITINLAELIEDIDGEVFKRDNIILGSALYGSLTLNAAGEVTYRPDDNYFGLDNFTYSVKDQAGAYSEMAAIEIDVTNVNDAPVIWNKWKDPSVRAGEQNHIILPNDIFKDFDGDDISLSLAMADGSEIPGWVVFDDVNNVIITNPSDGDAGKLDLILSASDGEFTTDKEFSLAINKPLTVRENKKINIIEGSDDADLVTSESGVSDVIFAGAGDDNIIYNIDDLWGAGYYAENAYSGERVNLVGKIRSYDAFDGGDGDDTLYLTDGDDSIFLDDLISDNGTISGSRLFGIEVINALGGSDVIDLSSNIFTYGSVEINGSDGNDVIWSNDGNDEINAGGGNDNIHGGSGDDIINGGLGQDTLTGGVGSDIFDFTGLDESVKGNADVITDFESGADFIHLIDLGLSFADLEISNNNGSTFINDNNSDFSIEFHGIIDLSESDFIFGS